MKKTLIISMMIITLLTFGCSDKNNTTSIEPQDTFELQKQSEHFDFYSLKSDIESVQIYEKALEEHFNEITENLNCDTITRIRVNVYKDIETYHETEFGGMREEWMIGSASHDKISIVSPFNPGKYNTYDTLVKAVVHEFVHCVTYKITKKNELPTYLSEGIAMYEAKQLNSRGKEFIKRKIEEDDIPEIRELRSNEFAKLGGYEFSYTFIEYLVETYGYDTMLEVIKKPIQVNKITDKSREELNKDWQKFVRDNYS